MNKFLVLFIGIQLSFFQIKAQWVTIPDANFVAWLTQQYPNCMNGNQMDTTCPDVITAADINVTGLNISDLTGIEYFHNLSFLQCGANQLTFLPPLSSNLILLSCYNNQLTFLPPLPQNISYLFCFNNQIISIPPLPNVMNALFIDSNNVVCLYNLPNTILDSADISNNPLTCVPNQTNYCLGLPVCIDNDPVNNPNSCQSTLDIWGFVYTDLNGNCSYDPGDLGSNNVPVKLLDNQNNPVSQSYTNSGFYSFTLNQPGTYKVKIETSNLPLALSCAQADSQIVNLISLSNGIANVNFSIECNNAYDVSVQSVSNLGIIFPGQIHTMNTHVSSNEAWYNIDCNSPAYSGIVTIEVTGPVTYVGNATNALIPQVSGNNFSYNILDFSSLLPTSFGLNFITDSTAQSGDDICVHVENQITPLDADTTNNVYDFCFQVVNSYDPNMKEVYPVNVLPGYEDWFTYTIHFQNTGTAPAFNIRLRDTLDTQLELSTFEILGYSHPLDVSLNSNILTVRFNNIMLPDSTSDYEGSMGFFQYRLKPLPNLPKGSQIENTAYIYFDYNTPVVTNTTRNNFEITGSIKRNFNEEFGFVIYPNPSNGVFIFKDTQNLKTIEIYSLLGERILLQGNQKEIDLSNFSSGLYFAKINELEVIKLVKE